MTFTELLSRAQKYSNADKLTNIKKKKQNNTLKGLEKNRKEMMNRLKIETKK